ncbi:MAG: oligoendopeptidase F [Tenericutes bacterium]|nr:oligoendopeptidase F [Mycoplasmatota bacterium]
MALEEKLRNDIKDEYKWDLSKIYSSKEDWQKDFDVVKEEILKIKDYKDNFLKDGKKFYEFLKYDENVSRRLEKIYYYAHLNYDADTLNEKYKVMMNKVSDLYVIYNELSSFVTPELLKLDKKKLESFYDDEEKLKEYKFNIENIYRYKEHTLDEDKERMLSNLSNCLSSPEEIYEVLTDSDFEYDYIIDENGNKVKFNESNYSLFIKSKDRNIRKKAFEMLHDKYKKYIRTIATIYKSEVETNVVTAKIKNYDSAISASLYSDNVPVKIYDNLIKVVNDNLNVLYNYYDLKKKILSLDEFHMYDTYVEIINKVDKKYTFDEAKEMVISALSVLGDEYISNLKKAFDEKWIDIYHNKGKRSGAYSSGNYDINPYVLLNYEGTLDDVSTLAHELGHSMHTYLSCHNNPYQYSSYEIFVAEVASTVNELLLANYMLKNSKDKNEKLAIINHILDLYKATLFRQTMFAEFEQKTHSLREQGEVLTSDLLSNIYYDLIKKYFGKNVVCDDLIKYEWARIPHFYYGFYVYKYATGISAASYIVDGILNNKEGQLESYINFLKTGGSMYPLDELKVANIDLTNEEVIQSAIKTFEKYIKEFIEIYNS